MPFKVKGIIVYNQVKSLNKITLSKVEVYKEMKEFDFEKLEFVDSFVVFLDVLGFSELVNSDNEEELQKINFYFWIVEKYLQKLQNELDEINQESIKLGAEKDTSLKLDYILISDSIIITVKQIKYDVNDLTTEMQNDTQLQDLYSQMQQLFNILNKQGFEKLCESIENIQKTLASHNVWIRGAITVGKTHISTSKKQIIGKAYIDAYKLESKAIYPRVIIDEKIIQELYYKDEEEFIKFTPYMFHWDNTKLEKDIPLFVDYLRFSVAIPNNEIFVKQIVDNISTEYEKSKGQPHHNKYVWMIEYMKICLERGDKSYSDLLDILNNI